jgi:hypothetical protein
VSFGFAATSFVCLTRIFGITGDNQTADMLLSANCFAMWLPILIGATLIYQEASDHPAGPKWVQVIAIIFALVSGVADLGCFVGIYWFLHAISGRTGDLFLASCLSAAGVIAIAMGARYFAVLKQRTDKLNHKAKASTLGIAAKSRATSSMDESYLPYA